MIELRIVKVGNALGMPLPSEVLSRLQLADGDRVILTESPHLCLGKTFRRRASAGRKTQYRGQPHGGDQGWTLWPLCVPL